MASDISRPALLSVTEALARVIDAMPLMQAEEVSVADAFARVTAAPVLSRRTQPPTDVSAMDGYAVRAADVARVPATLKRIGSAPAGGSFDATVGRGEAVRIFTGGPVPDGANAVVIQEHVVADFENDGATITVRNTTSKGHYIRPAGLDFREGDVGIKAGHSITARDAGLAAAMNVPWIRVRQRPKVAILATGDEIVRPGETVGANQIVSSNSFALSALVRACGGEPTILGIAPDTIEGIQQLLRGARGADLVLTTGGASVGEHDLIQQALGPKASGPDSLEVNFWRIAMRPGKPLIFGKVGETPLLGLPGNPVSTLVCGMIFVKPAIEAMLGVNGKHHAFTRAKLGCALAPNDDRQDYLRATLTIDEHGGRTAVPFDKQDSSMLARLAEADCLVIRPPHDPARTEGELINILEISGSIASL